MAEGENLYDSFIEYIDLSGHIDFAELLIGKYEWDNETRQRLYGQLSSIRAKQKDKYLNLSVVGEFSTGKSSFINAIIGEKLLVSSVIQGTTLVNTIIEYYQKPLIYVLKTDNTYDIETLDSIEELSVRLSNVATNPKIAREIKMVRVGIPSPLLAEGLRIIDTPGTNSTESWHEDVTKYALKNLSDLSIILTDALHPLSQTLVDFIEENLSEIYNQCAFVVTYYDKLRKQDRQETLRYIEKKLSLELEMDDPQVFPYVSPAILASKEGLIIMPDQDEMVRVSMESRSRIRETMWRNRQISQIKKLLFLTKETYGLLESNIEGKRDRLNKEYDLLLKTKQTPLESFVDSEKQKRMADFGQQASELKDELIASIGNQIEKAKVLIKDKVLNSQFLSVEAIQQYIKKEIPTECNLQAHSVVEIMKGVNKSLSRAFYETIRDYQRNFEGQFKKLGILSVNIGSISTIDKPKEQLVSLNDLKDSLDYMSNEVSKENWSIGGGGVAGAALGTAIMPGIGTVIGGFLGMMVGAINGPSADVVKKNACEKLSGSIESLFRTVERDIISTFNENVISYKSAIGKEIDRYLERYKSTIDRRIDEHNSLMEKNQRQISKVIADLKLITLRRNQLKSISEKIK